MELVDALASGASARKGVRVRLPPRAPKKKTHNFVVCLFLWVSFAALTSPFGIPMLRAAKPPLRNSVCFANEIYGALAPPAGRPVGGSQKPVIVGDRRGRVSRRGAARDTRHPCGIPRWCTRRGRCPQRPASTAAPPKRADEDIGPYKKLTPQSAALTAPLSGEPKERRTSRLLPSQARF